MRITSYCLLLLGLSGCASRTIIRDREYHESTQRINSLQLQEALKKFPTKESTGFITNYEKSWIQFWSNDKKDYSVLHQQARSFDKRNYISLSKEGEQWLFQESSDGYIPSEPEVISNYLLLAQYEMLDGKFAEARVDLKKATEILQKDSHDLSILFDDPSLRMWIGSLWLALGEWSEARVDFRRAFELTRDKRYLSLSELPEPPGEWNLIFWGTSPNWVWDRTRLEPQFSVGLRPNIEGEGNNSESVIYASTSPLFKRHVERLNKLREFALKSNYMTQFISDEAWTATKKTSATLGAASIAATGILLGTGIVVGGLYLLAKLQGDNELSKYLIEGGVAVGSMFYYSAKSLYGEWTEEIAADAKTQEDDRRTYRFVRYFPSWIIINTGHWISSYAEKKQIVSPDGKTKVNLFWRPE